MRVLICCLMLSGLAACGSSGFLPAGCEPPVGFETAEFRVRPITVADAEKDYEAVMESIDVIHAALLGDSWPTEEHTLEQNERDMAAKERKFARHDSFTYTVVSLDESRVLGCIYINEGIGGPDAAVFTWVRSSEQEGGLDARLEAAVRDWIARDWPFAWVVYPGRGAPWRRP